jgi:hypothetical protein
MAPPRKLTKAGSRPPTSQLGAVLGGAFSPAGLAPWSEFVDTDEWTPELQWPRSVDTYNKMRADTQLAGLYWGTVLPILHFNWMVNPNGADENVVDRISRDYNLQIQGEEPRPQGRAKRRFVFKRHLQQALKAGIWGHYYFEQVGEIGDDLTWHLRKLAGYPPRTIHSIRVADDGGLISIQQNVGGNISATAPMGMPEIPVDRLVAYVWDQDEGSWVGRSWFRECYKNWLIKDRLMRIDAINHEKAGGWVIPIAPPGSTPAVEKELAQMSADLRVGEETGASIPAGGDVRVIRATGGAVVDSMRYQDEAMARRFLLMVLQLGQTQTGSRALGTTFVDFFSQGLVAIAEWFQYTFNEHVIEDDVDWNEGEDTEVVPLLTFEFDPELAVQDLVNLIGSGAIVVDQDLEEELRKELGLPRKQTGAPAPISQQEQRQMELEQEKELAEQAAEAAREISEREASQEPPVAAPAGEG